MIVTLKEIKQHLELDLDERRDDEYLTGLIHVAEEMAEKYVNTPLTTFPTPTPWSIRHAVKVAVGHLYAVDRMGTENAKPSTLFHRLLSPYVNYDPDLT